MKNTFAARMNEAQARIRSATAESKYTTIEEKLDAIRALMQNEIENEKKYNESKNSYRSELSEIQHRITMLNTDDSDINDWESKIKVGELFYYDVNDLKIYNVFEANRIRVRKNKEKYTREELSQMSIDEKFEDAGLKSMFWNFE